MTISVIQKLAASFTDTTLPKLFRDPLMTSGTLLLFDFLNAYCNPNADGALSVGTTFNNLVDGGAGGVIAVNGISSLSGKAGLSMTGGSASTKGITFGAVGAFDDSAIKHSWLWTIWLKTVASSPTTGYCPFLQLSPAGASTGVNSQLWSDTGSDGYTVRFQQGNGSGTTNSQRAATANGAVAQVAYRMTPSDGTFEMFYNGASTGLASTGGPTSPLSAAAMTVGIGSNYKGTIYRTQLEDLSVSGVAAASQVLLDYNTNSARFT